MMRILLLNLVFQMETHACVAKKRVREQSEAVSCILESARKWLRMTEM
jgi:hypothetical protein